MHEPEYEDQLWKPGCRHLQPYLFIFCSALSTSRRRGGRLLKHHVVTVAHSMHSLVLVSICHRWRVRTNVPKDFSGFMARESLLATWLGSYLMINKTRCSNYLAKLHHQRLHLGRADRSRHLVLSNNRSCFCVVVFVDIDRAPVMKCSS